MIAIIAAVVTVTSRNLLYAVLALAVASLAVAGLMLTLSAEFLAFVVILVYVGAVVVIGVFAVMLTGQFKKPTLPPSNELKILGAGVAAALTGILIGVVLVQPIAPVSAAHTVSVQQIGRLLLTEYVLPFELVSVLLLAALVGAIVIARGKEAQ
ncbi:NADH-quinone oxidoreductase subunit J [bacterium]|nr:NADH-quinone oxidoreductase subunit J [bacterium]